MRSEFICIAKELENLAQYHKRQKVTAEDSADLLAERLRKTKQGIQIETCNKVHNTKGDIGAERKMRVTQRIVELTNERNQLDDALEWIISVMVEAGVTYSDIGPEIYDKYRVAIDDKGFGEQEGMKYIALCEVADETVAEELM